MTTNQPISTVTQGREGWLLALLTGTVFFLMNWQISGPVYQADEGGYLANAATIAGFPLDVASSYHAGYSILLSPAFLLGDSAEAVYVYVKIINSALWALTGLMLYNLLLKAFPNEGRYRVLLATLVALLFPAWVTMNGYAFPTSAIVFFYTLSALLLLKTLQSGGIFWLLTSATVGYLYFIHPGSLAITISSAAVLFVIAHSRGEWLYALIAVAMTLVLIATYNHVVSPWLIQTMTFGDYPPETHYPSSTEVLFSLFTLEGLQTFLVRSAGQLNYLLLSTLGVIAVPILWIATQRKALLSGSAYPSVILVAYLSLSLIGIWAVSSLSMTAFEGQRLDQWMYGRYIEGFTLPLLAIGILLWKPTFGTYSLLITIVSAVILIAGLPEAAESFTNLNGLGLWQGFLVPFDPAGDSPSKTLLLWNLATLPVFVLIILTRQSARTRHAILASVFAVTALLQLGVHTSLSKNFTEPRYDFASRVNSLFPESHCVAFHQDGWPPGDIWLVYAFHFYQKEFPRIHLDNWQTTCEGPLLSSWDNIDILVPGMSPFVFERDQGLYLWGDIEKSSVKTEEAWCPPITCIDLGQASTQIGRFSKDPDQATRTIDSTGLAGYLAYGPYTPVRAGNYMLEIRGEVTQGEGEVVVDVVSSGHSEPLAYFEGIKKPAPNAVGLLLKEEVNIPFDSKSIEVRVYVSEGVTMKLTEYTLQP